MTANAGYHAYTTGDVLTAAQVQYNLQNQTIMYFATSAARTTAIGAVLVEGMVTYIPANGLEYYNGAAWVTLSTGGDITGVTAGTGISGGGTSGTVTVTNSMATEITAAGDIIVGTGSGTFDNLPIGTTNQILTADTTVSPYKVKWATPAAAASGMTLINRTTYASAASIIVDSVFSSTYASYVIIMENIGAVTTSDSMRFRWRVGSTTQTGATYYGNAITTQHYNTTITNTPTSALAYFQMTTAGMGGQSAATYGRAWYQVQGVGNSAENPVIFGNHYTCNNTQNNQFAGSYDSSQTYTGFIVTSSSTNVAGTIAVYGIAKA